MRRSQQRLGAVLPRTSRAMKWNPIAEQHEERDAADQRRQQDAAAQRLVQREVRDREHGSRRHPGLWSSPMTSRNQASSDLRCARIS